jgi:hypothetical protein
MKNTVNTFTENQTISKDTFNLLTLKRPVNSANEWSINFDANNSSSANKTYAVMKAGLSDATAGSEDGYITFQTITGGALSSKMFISNTGTVSFGTNQRLILTDSGLTGGRTMTFPNADTTLVGTDVTQTLSNKTIGAGGLTITAATAGSIATPTAGFVNLFFDSGTSKLSIKDSAGTTTPLH